MLLVAITLLTAIAPQDRALYDRLCRTVVTAYDTSLGGLVFKNGTPIEPAVELSFRQGAEGRDPQAADRAVRTMQWTLGLLDTVGGGFVNGTVDMDPRRASLDKMTIPNARRLGLLMDAWSATGDARWRRTSARVVDYFDRVLLDGRGGFVHGQIGDRQLVPESNGHAIRAWLEWAARNQDPRGRAFAWKSLDRVWSECWAGSPGFVRRDFFGAVERQPMLVDQVEMGRAYLVAAHLAGREIDLTRARTIADTMLRVYQDPRGGFRTVAIPNGKGGFKNSARRCDENAIAARFLAELAAVAGNTRYREAARRALGVFQKDLEKPNTIEAAEWALAIRALHSPELPARPSWKEPATVRTGAGRR